MLDNVTYYSASAGSGKTHTLTHELANLIANGSLEPEKVILTTFTKVAAAEFKEKAKAVLYEKGMFDAAARLDSARIGTVHSVAESFIHKFWYHLGVSPDFQVMSEENKDFYVTQSLASIATDAEKALFREFTRFFELKNKFKSYDYEFWKSPLKQAIGHATNYGITDFTKSRAKSIEAIKKIFTGNCSLNSDRDYLLKNLNMTLDTILPKSSTKTGKDRVDTLQAAIKMLSSGKSLRLKEYAKMKEVVVKLPKTFTTPDIIAFGNSLADEWQSREVQELFVAYVNALFDILSRWQNEFAEYKRQKHLVDFNDMEKLMVDLLKKDEVVDDIRAEYDYLFVDEFQDSSPMQVAIFTRLSEIVKKCIWVGDSKQAIYGFRGADTELVKSVVSDIKDLKPLDTSYRSVKSLVEFSNKLFEQPFAAEGISANQVCLKPYRPDIEGAVSLECWGTGGNKQVRYGQIASQLIREVEADPEHLSDIAVLARNNDDLDGIANILASYGVPVNWGIGNVSGSQQWALLKSLLSVVANPSDALARATVAYLSASGYNAGKLIDEKLIVDDYNRNRAAGEPWKNYLSDIPLLKALDSIAKSLEHQSVRAVVETLVVELDLCKVTAHMEGDSGIVFHTIIDAGVAYESKCLSMSMPATIYGFIEWIADSNLTIGGDVHGVNFYTIHKSKGLQWKTVALVSLDGSCNDTIIMKRNYMGVQLRKEPGFSVANMSDSAYIRVMPQPFEAYTASVAESVSRNIMADPEYDSYVNAQASEDLRIMYVAITRAADRLCLEKCGEEGAFSRLTSVGVQNADSVIKEMSFFSASAEDAEGYHFARKPEFLPKLAKNSGASYENRDVLPSSTYGTFVGNVSVALDVAAAEDRIPVEWGNLAPEDMNVVGTCIHNIFASLDLQADKVSFAKNMILSHGVEKYLPLDSAPDRIVGSWNRFTKYLTENFGVSVKVYHELPFHHLHNGQIVKGSMDFVWQTANGSILVDFKNLFIGSDKTCLDSNAEHYLGKYKGQFDCYEQVLAAHGESVLDRLIYMPITGRVVKIEK